MVVFGVNSLLGKPVMEVLFEDGLLGGFAGVEIGVESDWCVVGV